MNLIGWIKLLMEALPLITDLAKLIKQVVAAIYEIIETFSANHKEETGVPLSSDVKKAMMAKAIDRTVMNQIGAILPMSTISDIISKTWQEANPGKEPKPTRSLTAMDVSDVPDITPLLEERMGLKNKTHWIPGTRTQWPR